MSSNRRSFDPHAFCALPLVRRAYQSLVVAVAVFILTLVGLREPFRGYLAEVQIAGPVTEGLDLEAAVAWLKESDRQVAAVARSAGEISAKSQIRATYAAPRPTVATMHLDRLAERWLYQYLPDRMQAYRRAALADLRSTVQSAREREDAAHQRLEGLRQQQLALLMRTAKEPQSQQGPGMDNTTGSGVAPSEGERKENAEQGVSSRGPDGPRSPEQLEILKLELSRLLAGQTEEHPQVVAVRQQIAAMEKQLGAVQSEGPELKAAAQLPGASRPPLATSQGLANHFVSASASAAVGGDAAQGEATALGAEMKAAIDELSWASRERQRADQRLSERMQEVASQPTAAQWSAARAYIVLRLGGTPRSSTLAVAGLFSAVAGVLMFRAAAFAVCQPKIGTTGELASALELPVIGNLSSLRAAAARIRRRLCTPRRVKAILIVAEVVVGVAVVACLAAMAMEPALARQVVADPFGTLSEVIGRFGG